MSGMTRFAAGDGVHTPLGKGIVREVRRNGRLLVEIQGRAVVIDESSVKPIEEIRPKRGPKRATAPEPASGDIRTHRPHAAAEVDLHGLTVDEAVARAEQALNDAMLADLSELRLIHGRSGGRIRAALHQRLRHIPTVRGVRLDPRNAGVTIVSL
jgi:DNA mismatch repair protein MutS2